ncbi:hypothetical protein [Labrys sp. ZIDIC5]|uniref:hypothetical protein n=1 Tax=Labrys sedimenti TaxID=3106036 RepID=UPI002ACA3920|nr:hypothetical protein [Labrys sp. ZIDIC5]MDZ5448890.1 hypothetical protein [Labrys sp. ZIDIC5]
MSKAPKASDDKGAIAAAAVLIFIVLAGLLWHPANAALCPPTDAMLKGNPALNCFDFWLNRYQTLLTGIFTLAAAAAAFFAVSVQIHHNEKLATRDGRHGARALVAILRLCHQRMVENYGSRLSDVSRINADFVTDGCVATIDVVIRNIDAIRDRLFSDDLAEALNVYNNFIFFKERLIANKNELSYFKIFKDLVRIENEIERQLAVLIAAIQHNAAARSE